MASSLYDDMKQEYDDTTRNTDMAQHAPDLKKEAQNHEDRKYKRRRSSSPRRSVGRDRSRERRRRNDSINSQDSLGRRHDKPSRRMKEETKDRDPRSSSRRRSRSRNRGRYDERSRKDSRSHDRRGSKSPDRKKENEKSDVSKSRRRTGWDANAAAAASLPFNPIQPPPSTQASSGFTSALSGKTADQIQSELAERQLQAAALASSMQSKASLHQLCRIYVGSLDYSLTDTDIRQVFSAFGAIVNIDMPKEGNRSKGFCFVEYTNPESAEMALQTMAGFQLKGRSIKIGRPTALGGQFSIMPNPTTPSNIAGMKPPGGVNAAEAGQMAAALLLGKGEALGRDDSQNRVYVGSVPYTFTADDIKQIFEVFGSILSCQLIPSNERPGTHRGYGFIEFATFEQAKLAIETMNDFQLGGKTLKVNYATAVKNLPGMIMPGFSSPPPQSATGANSLPVPYGNSATVPNAASAGMAALSGLNLSGSDSASSLSNIPTPAGPDPHADSPILLLCNMVDSEEVNSDLKDEVINSFNDAYQDTLEWFGEHVCSYAVFLRIGKLNLLCQIQQECSKYGAINQVEVAINPTDKAVRIFVVFVSVADCDKALPALHNRWFGERKIAAKHYDESAFHSKDYWL